MENVSQLFPTFNRADQMTVGYSFKVVFREHVNKKGLRPLYLRIIINRKKRDLPMGLEADPLFFNLVSGRLERNEANTKHWKFTDQEASDFNLMVSNLVARASNIFVEYRLAFKDPEMNDFIRQFTNYEKRDSFLTFFQNDLNARKDISKHTRELHQNTINLLKEFKAEIKFMDLTLDFLNSWDRWLRTEKEHGNNTRAREHRDFLQYINRAIASGIRLVSPYEGFKWPPVTRSIEFLTQDELQKWTDYYFSQTIGPKHKVSLRYFLFMCYTSLRVSDAKKMLNSVNEMINDSMLVFIPTKTKNTKGEIVQVPLNDMAKKFMSTIRDEDFKSASDNKLNLDLKEIAAILECKKNISTKVGRHTFATVFLERGGSVEVLQKILGHSDIKETMVYSHITDKRTKEQMSGAFDSFYLSNTDLWGHLKLKPERKKGSGRKKNS